jgi:BirA family transcriptional regulator, biotin operon repressor / biotin---[acetyl-CoA-carboxylase] ligase
MPTGTVLSQYDETPCEELQRRSGAPRLLAVDRCASTMDVVHQLAADGAPHGCTVVADEQGAGRGRSGKAWTSARGAGVWVSVLLRHHAVAPSGVLSLRTGLELAQSLDALAGAPVRLKWPNDLFLDDRKLAGILTEARWRGDLLEWIVVGIGINVHASHADQPSACLAPGARRADVLVAAVSSALRAAACAGELSTDELSRYASRDIATGRAVDEPVAGTVLGVTPRGGLRIETATGVSVAVSGSLVFRTPSAE